MKKEEINEIKKGNYGYGLLIENDGYLSLPKKSLNENEDGTPSVPYPFIVNAVFQKYGIKNANGRIYPKDVLMREVEKYQELIRDRRAFGECNHPESSTIDLGRVSHNIIELHWENHTLVGKMELNVTKGFVEQGICSSLGDTVANLLINGYKIGVSSRGVGSVEQKFGETIVGDDFQLICWDVVSEPSTPQAYIGKEEEMQAYVENSKHDGKLISEGDSTANKIDRINEILDAKGQVC